MTTTAKEPSLGDCTRVARAMWATDKQRQPDMYADTFEREMNTYRQRLIEHARAALKTVRELDRPKEEPCRS